MGNVLELNLIENLHLKLSKIGFAKTNLACQVVYLSFQYLFGSNFFEGVFRILNDMGYFCLDFQRLNYLNWTNLNIPSVCSQKYKSYE